MVIVAAIMPKLLHLCFAIIKSNPPFHPNFTPQSDGIFI